MIFVMGSSQMVLEFSLDKTFPKVAVTNAFIKMYASTNQYTAHIFFLSSPLAINKQTADDRSITITYT